MHWQWKQRAPHADKLARPQASDTPRLPALPWGKSRSRRAGRRAQITADRAHPDHDDARAVRRPQVLPRVLEPNVIQAGLAKVPGSKHAHDAGVDEHRHLRVVSTLVGWVAVRLVGCLLGWFVSRPSVGRSVGRSVGWLLDGLLVDFLAPNSRAPLDWARAASWSTQLRGAWLAARVLGPSRIRTVTP